MLHRNIYRIYLLNLLTGLVFWYSIEKLFLQSLGAGPFGVSLSALVFLVTLILFDVPSGVLADRWKRTYTLLLALGCFIAACIMGGLSTTWVQYLPMNILLGGFVVLTSGTFQAIMYDSLRDSGHEKDYDKHQGRAYALFLAGLAISSLAGGYLAEWYSMRATYFITAAMMIPAVIAALTLTEPRSHKQMSDSNLRQHITGSIRHIFTHRLLMQLALLITAAGVLRGTQNEYSGLLFIALGLTAIPLGYAGAIKWLVGSIGQVIAPRIGRKVLRLTPLFFTSFLVFSLLANRWSMLFFYISGFLYAVIVNQAEAAVQDQTPSEVRATTLSVLSFASNVLLVPLGLLFGWIAQETTIFNAYFVIGVLGLLYLVSWWIQGRPVLRSLYGSRRHDGVGREMEEELA